MTSGARPPAEQVQLTLDLAYAFDRPAHHLDIELRVRPLLAAGAGLPPIRLASEPDARFEPPEIDANGVAVDRLKLAGPVSRLRLNASFDHRVDPEAALPALTPTAADLALEGLADVTGSTPWPQVLVRLRDSWRYSDDPRDQPQTLREIAQRRTGSCEAIARLAVEIIRARGLPARFVGGYRLAGLHDDARPVRRHAWLAIWEGARWRMLDPLAQSGTGHCLVPTAFASRLPDIATIRGSFKGACAARLTVSAHARRHVVELD
ncbi:transglutaminase-like domain-containing protein [Bosea sp. NPDC055332]